jgi:hypothetical protein
MQENNFNKSHVLIIFLLFLFSSKLWKISWSICKSLLYIIVIIYVLQIIDPSLSILLKENINNMININSENNFFKNILSKLAFLVKKGGKTILVPSNLNNISANYDSSNVNNFNNTPLNTFTENKNLENIGDSNNRTLT